jgi:TRAP-type C4-dicarboxylate transport system permease small subunit
MCKRLEEILVACNRWLLIALMLIMACLVFANVVLRYTTGDSIVWAEEVSRQMMIWIAFLGAGLVLRFGGHVAIDNLHHHVGVRGARLIRALVVAGIALFSVVMVYASGQYMWLMRFQTTAATDIPISWIYLAMPVGFLLILAHLTFIAPAYIRQGEFAHSSEIDAEAAASL